MVGLPGQREAAITDTVAELRRMLPTALGVKALEHYPGARWEIDIVAASEEVARGQMVPLVKLSEELERAAAPRRRSIADRVLARLKKRWNPV
jgi:hypothetical protein